MHWIESDLYQRQGKAEHQFRALTPRPQSDLARELLKDPYNFDFLTLTREAEEREIERGLVEHIRDFLLELGVGFAFVGQQYRLEVGGEDFYLDLLFYHLKLRCFVVLELKAGAFKPEYRREDELLPVGRGRPAPAPRGPAVDRHHPVQVEEQNRRRVWHGSKSSRLG